MIHFEILRPRSHNTRTAVIIKELIKHCKLNKHPEEHLQKIRVRVNDGHNDSYYLY